MSIVLPDVARLVPPPISLAGAYRPRRPQDTLLHELVREHFPTFLAHTNRIYTRPLPRYVVREFEKYIACGDLSRGFTRCVCARCGLERAVPYSCKTRALCPSCAGRRMADSAARLVDSVLPDVPYRQWVLSLPFDLRLLAAMRADVLRDIVRIYVRTILRFMRRRLRLPGAPGGFVAATHRAGGALNLAPHFHVLAADGLFVRRPGPPRACRGAGDVGFHRVPAPSPTDLSWVVQTVRRGVLRRLARMGLLRDERLVGEATNEPPDPAALEACGALALRAGQLEAQDGPDAEPDDVPSGRRSSRWSAHEQGFNIHAGVRVPAGDHVGRERLCRYITRPPFSMERFTRLDDGRIAYRVRHPLGPGKTHRIMTPLETMARLAALVPPPRFPLLRYAGVFAANSPWRSAVVPGPPEAPVACRHPVRGHETTAPAPPAAPPSATPVELDPLLGAPPPVPRTLSADHWKRLDDGRLLAAQPRVNWADLLRRTWAEDILSCPKCRGRMALIEAVTDQADIRRHLDRLGLPLQPASFAPPRDPDDLPSADPPPRPGRGPPSPVPPAGAPSPPPDDFVDPPWHEDCQIPLYDDVSQVPPDAQN